jgi:hypothetical protein
MASQPVSQHEETGLHHSHDRIHSWIQDHDPIPSSAQESPPLVTTEDTTAILQHNDDRFINESPSVDFHSPLDPTSMPMDSSQDENEPTINPSLTVLVTDEQNQMNHPPNEPEEENVEDKSPTFDSSDAIIPNDTTLMDSNDPLTSPSLQDSQHPSPAIPDTIPLDSVHDTPPTTSINLRTSPPAEEIAQSYMLQLTRLHTQHESEIQQYQQRIGRLEQELAAKKVVSNPIAIHDKCLAQLRKLEKQYQGEIQEKEQACIQAQEWVLTLQNELTSLQREYQKR